MVCARIYRARFNNGDVIPMAEVYTGCPGGIDTERYLLCCRDDGILLAFLFFANTCVTKYVYLEFSRFGDSDLHNIYVGLIFHKCRLFDFQFSLTPRNFL